MSVAPRILVVDDSSVIQEMFLDALTPEGCEVAVASNGEEALEQLRLALPDVIFLARVLPDTGGLALLRMLRQDPWTREIPVVFVTSASREKYVDEALQAGANGYLLKPFTRGAGWSTAFRMMESQLIGAEYSR
ncbi:MAG TPA: response regulator [Thermoguttaceae bacterium]|nr:response regulator [Thermoguttaceae bacterium]